MNSKMTIRLPSDPYKGIEINCNGYLGVQGLNFARKSCRETMTAKEQYRAVVFALIAIAGLVVLNVL